MRQKHQIERPRLAVACFIVSLRNELEPELIAYLLKLVLLNKIGSCLDSSQIYKFESGDKRPWSGAMENLAQAIEVLEPGLTVEQLFPEVEERD